MSVIFKVEDNIGTIEFNDPDAKVNILTSAVLKKLDALLDEVQNNSGLQALLMTSGKKDVFIAGADIKEIDGITESQDGAAKSKAGQDIFNKLEDLPIPTIAVIDGVTLGGGCELALACDYRVATFNGKVKIGLPEVNLGILPGFGGTYRLPRLIGLSESLKIILAGKAISHRAAFRNGLVDKLFAQRGLDLGVRQFVNEIKGSPKRQQKFNKKPKGFQAFLDKTKIGHLIVFDRSKKNVLKLSKGFYPAPLKALEVVQKTIGSGRQKALAQEAKAFSELVITDISKNLVHVFYLSEKFKKLSLPGSEHLKPHAINKCGVLGAGVMGGGIAQLLSYKDITARLKDINYEAVAKGFQSAYKVFKQAVKRRRLEKAQAEVKMAMISGTVDFSGFQNADCVIEAVVEKMEIKKKVFQEISTIVPEETILCTNTSALSVTEMAQAATNPGRVVGFHFFNPVHRMPLIEIIKTDMTSEQTIVTALGLARRLGKTPILVKDAPGFLVNRILLGYINEAGFILEEGADMECIDKVMTDFGMPMGPLTLSDEVGLDVGGKVLHILHEGLGDRFKPAKIFDKVTEKGLLGRKSGKGFYIHKNKKKIPNPEINSLMEKNTGSSNGPEGPSGKTEEYRDRMVFVMINEAARCLGDGIVQEPAAVDVGMIMGTGFPPFRGGLLRYADHLGIDKIFDGLIRFQAKFHTSRFEPCPYLQDLKASHKKFYH